MKLSIGEVSKIFNISKETLRYYDKIGILKPEINEQNGYRFYEFKHLEKLGLILGIKLLGISLADIKKTIESEDLNEYKNLVLKQEEILQIKKKELEYLEDNLNKSKKVLNAVTDFKNEYNFENLKITQKSESLYSLDMQSILNSSISSVNSASKQSEYSSLNTEIDSTCFYVYNIIENKLVKEDDNIIFINEITYNTDSLSRYLEDKNINPAIKTIIGKSISVNFYGTVDEINNYILELNKYFKCPENNIAYVTYDFYLPKKKDDVSYFVNINLKIDED